MVILYVALAGVVGDKLYLVQSDVAKAATAVTASGVLGYGASLIGFSITYTSLASDFVSFKSHITQVSLTGFGLKTTSLPPQTPGWKLFLCVYIGMIVPIILCQIFGAACQLAAYSIPDWETASNIGVPNLIYTMTGNGNGASRFVMVLFCLSVVANTAPTIYSAGLSGQVAIPWLVRGEYFHLQI